MSNFTISSLIESENEYVNLLSLIIKHTASAWSRNNFPPSELDGLFRSIEQIFKAHTAFMNHLKSMPPPQPATNSDRQSAEQVANALLSFSATMQKIYERYCSVYFTDFDNWLPVRNTVTLQPLLDKIPPWTLDSLFRLPADRLHFYCKLMDDMGPEFPYLDTQRQALDDLRYQISCRPSIDSDSEDKDYHGSNSNNDRSKSPPQPISPPLPSPPYSVQFNSHQQQQQQQQSQQQQPPPPPPSLPPQRFSSPVPPAPPPPHFDLETLQQTIDTNHTLDIFTMQPRPCKLQIQPEGLAFQRRLTAFASAVVRFTPSSTNEPIMLRAGVLFLLSDLFLLCCHLPPVISADPSRPEPTARLTFPPLAGRFLSVQRDVSNTEALLLSVMKRETLHITFESAEVAAKWFMHFEDCISFANSNAKPAVAAPPPVLPNIEAMSISTAPTYPTSPTANSTFSGNFPSPDFATFPERASSVSTSRSISSTQYDNGVGLGYPASQSNQQGSSRFQPSVPMQGRNNSLPGVDVQKGFLLPPTPPTQPVQQQYLPGPPPLNGALPPAPVRYQPNYNSQMQPPQQQLYANNYQQPQPQSYIQQQHLSQPPQVFNQMMPNARSSSAPPISTRSNPVQSSSGSVTHSPSNFSIASGSGRTASFIAPSEMLLQQPNGEEQSLEDEFRQYDASPPRPSASKGSATAAKSILSAQFSSKVFLKTAHSQWKSLGAAKTRLYIQAQPDGNSKQLVVQNDKNTLISTIVLDDAVTRVGKTGVAVELSDKGQRTGIVYMLQASCHASRVSDARADLFNEV